MRGWLKLGRRRAERRRRHAERAEAHDAAELSWLHARAWQLWDAQPPGREKRADLRLLLATPYDLEAYRLLVAYLVDVGLRGAQARRQEELPLRTRRNGEGVTGRPGRIAGGGGGRGHRRGSRGDPA